MEGFEGLKEFAIEKLGLEKCKKSILSLNFNDVNCVKLTISKV